MRWRWKIDPERRRVALWALLVAGCVFVATAGSENLAMTYVAVVATVLAALAILLWKRIERLLLSDELIGLTLAVAGDAAAFGIFRSLIGSLRAMIASGDPIYRELALDRFEQICSEANTVAAGRVDFAGTQAWRRVYEQILSSRGIHHYRSVAYARTPNYWQDEPGRQSTRVNLEMARQGMLIERIVIVPDVLWPNGHRLPVEPLSEWLNTQVQHGIMVSLVRDSILHGDTDLRADFGLYGNRAVGHQVLDDQGRTVHFRLSFDFAELLATERRWDRLSVYATRYEELGQLH